MVNQIAAGAVPNTAGESEMKSLTDRMKERTKQIHQDVTFRPFLEKIRREEADERSYCQYLTDLRAVFEELEFELSFLPTDSALSGLYVANLCRKEAISNDIAQFQIESLESGKAAKEYVRHLKEIGSKKPHLLAAHAYTHFLALLFGGQLLGGHVRKKWENAAQMYDFNDLLKETGCKATRDYANQYKDKLNQIPFTAAEQEELVEEAQAAFEMTDRMVQELEPSNER